MPNSTTVPLLSVRWASSFGLQAGIGVPQFCVYPFSSSMCSVSPATHILDENGLTQNQPFAPFTLLIKCQTVIPLPMIV